MMRIAIAELLSVEVAMDHESIVYVLGQNGDCISFLEPFLLGS